jgi:hypothetical protein
MRERAALAKAAWIASLETNRRSWPEWSELEQRVRDREFVIHTIGPHMFILAPGSRTAPPLSRQTTARGAPVPEVADPFPRWVSALVGLGCEGAGDLASSGVLAGSLWPPDKLRPLTAREDHGCELAPANHPQASRIFILQCNRSGTPIFSDGASVLGWAWQSKTFEEIAPLEVFLRFCLRHSLAGEDWWAAWTRGDGQSEGILPAPRD